MTGTIATAARALLLTTLSLGAVGAVEAARYGVRVVDESGEPVPGASVCIGLEGNYRQFGTAFTDAEGRAAPVEVPNVPLVVTVSKTRFAGVRRHEAARGFDLVREITLGGGVPGPRCKAGSSIVANPPVLDVREVDVAAGPGTTTLTPDVSGAPSHYRVGFDRTLDGAAWQPFEQRIALSGALAEAPSVYLQLRRLEGDPKGWVEARSDVVTVALPRR